MWLLLSLTLIIDGLILAHSGMTPLTVSIICILMLLCITIVALIAHYEHIVARDIERLRFQELSNKFLKIDLELRTNVLRIKTQLKSRKTRTMSQIEICALVSETIAKSVYLLKLWDKMKAIDYREAYMLFDEVRPMVRAELQDLCALADRIHEEDE